VPKGQRGVDMKKKKKRKKKVRRPPLSWWNKALYALAVAVLVAGLFALLIGFFSLQNAIAFRDPSVIAYKPRASLLWCCPFWLYLMLTFAVILYTRYLDRIPLFAPRQEKGAGRVGLALWCAGFLLTLCLVPFSLCGRKCMTDAGSFATYNAFNREVGAGYRKDDVTEIGLYTYYDLGGRYSPSRWSYRMEFDMNDGKGFSFYPYEFRGKGEEKLENLIRIRDSFSSAKITVEGEDRLDDVIEDMNMDDREAALLRELFGVTG